MIGYLRILGVISLWGLASGGFCALRNINGKMAKVGDCQVPKKGDVVEDLRKRKDREACASTCIDIIFLVDGSQSVGKSNFNISKQWLVDVIRDTMATYGDSVRTQVLQYSDADPPVPVVQLNESTKFETPYVLNDDLTIDEIERKINSMVHLSERYTYTYYALRRASEWDFPQSTRYERSQKVVVVVTGSDAADAIDLGSWWNAYGETGIITPIAIGIGGFGETVMQLQQLANGGSSNDRVHVVGSYQDLHNITAEQLIADFSSDDLSGIPAQA